jgi:hypothetical protein
VRNLGPHFLLALATDLLLAIPPSWIMHKTSVSTKQVIAVVVSFAKTPSIVENAVTFHCERRAG